MSSSISTTLLSSTTSDIIPSPVISVTASSAVSNQLTVLPSITDEISGTTTRSSIFEMPSSTTQSSIPILHSTTLMASPTPSSSPNWYAMCSEDKLKHTSQRV